MRRLFDERARLVIYLEREDLEKFEERARGKGKTGQELARELVGGLFAGVIGGERDHDTERARGARGVGVGGRGAGGGGGSVGGRAGGRVGEASVGGEGRLCQNCLPGRRIEMKADGKGMVVCPECRRREAVK